MVNRSGSKGCKSTRELRLWNDMDAAATREWSGTICKCVRDFGQGVCLLRVRAFFRPHSRGLSEILTTLMCGSVPGQPQGTAGDQ